MEFVKEAGNKMSLRSTSIKQIKRISWISNNMGALGDLLTSTFESIIIASLTICVPLFIGFAICFQHNRGATAKENIVPFVLIVIGSILLGINALMVNPSQGSQITVSFKYLNNYIGGNHHREIQDVKPYCFYKKAYNKSILESIYSKNKRKHYIAVFRVQGSVSKTSFDSDLEILRNLNRGLLKTMDRTTTRTTINFIGSPQVEIKKVNPNATPAMRARAYDLYNAVQSLGDMQILKTYIILDSPSPRKLQKEINNHYNYFDRGLVVTAKLLNGNELKNTFRQLFG